MAARKRKIAQPKQAAELQTESEIGTDSELGSGGAAQLAAPLTEVEIPVPEAENPDVEARGAAQAEDEVPFDAPVETEHAPDSESERVTLLPRDVDAEEPEAQPDFDEALLGEGPSEVDESRVDDTGAYLKGLLEALLFVSDRPLEIKDLARAAKIDKRRVEELIEEIRSDYQHRGVRLDEVGDGFAFRSNPAYSEYVRGYLSLRPVRLSRAQLETLSIVAYRQPITRPEVDDIRGVDAGPVLKGLLERDLIRIIGKKDEPGRPMLYGTTQTFLQVFSLKSLRDLPTLREFTELNDESRKVFAEELGEEAPEGPISFEQAMAGDANADAEGAESEAPSTGGEEADALEAGTAVDADPGHSEGVESDSEKSEFESGRSEESEDAESEDDEDDEDDDDDDDDDEDDDEDDDDDDDDDEDDEDDDEDDDDDEDEDDDDEDDDDEPAEDK